jgi:ELWxxDGT repeat protein
MWTDEQLREQGWTDEQIAIRRVEQAAEIATIQTELPEVSTSIPIVGEKIEALSTPLGSSGIASSMPAPMSAILLAAMLVLVSFSIYSISNAEGIEGASGNDGMNGSNGTDGSSFHLVVTAAELQTCNEDLNNQIFFIASQAMFQVCQNNAWQEIDLTGQAGLNGTDGNDGLNGTNGTNGNEGVDGSGGTDGQNGANGADGTNGENGLTSLIATRTEPIVEGCQNGGTIVETGVDDNGDNTLSVDEVDSFVVVCNGETGQDGSDGADGADGADGSSTLTMMVARLSIAPAFLGCNGTGELLQQGMDNGAGNGIALNGALESGEVISSILICTTFEVALVEDINPSGHSTPANFVTINSTMYFTANNGTASGIWAYDNGSISLVYSGSVLSLHAIGPQLMFAGQDAGFNVKPFVYEPSNGTAWQIKEIFPGGSSYPGEFTLIDTTVFFSARDSAGSTGIGLFDLWAYETVNFSVWKVEADIQPSSLLAVNSDLYFSAQPSVGVTGIELWKHEASTNTTFMVNDINPGSLSSSPQHLVAMGTTIYMSANAGTTHGTELYAYETTNNSVWLAANIRAGAASSSPSDLVVLGTQVYFQATSGTHFEMWVYESQNNSFREVTDIQSTSGANGPTELTVHQYTVYFSANDGTTGEELWAHNSINGTTWQVIDLKPTGGFIGDIHVHEGHVYFAGEDNWDGRELWRLIFSKDVSFV